MGPLFSLRDRGVEGADEASSPDAAEVLDKVDC